MAKEHAVQAAQDGLPLMGIRGEVVDVELLPVARVLIKLRDGRTVTVDRWLAVKLRTLLQQRFPRRFVIAQRVLETEMS